MQYFSQWQSLPVNTKAWQNEWTTTEMHPRESISETFYILLHYPNNWRQQL